MLIAQVTDIHVAPDNDHLQRFEQVLLWLRQVSPDVLILTGDLTDDDGLEGYEQIAARLDEQTYSSLLLPGNSDDRKLMRQTWGKSQWKYDGSAEFLNFSHHIGGIHLIGLDTMVSEKSYGSVLGRLEWLEKEVHETDGAPKMLFLHHHLFRSGIPSLDETMCRGLGELKALIRRSAGRILSLSSGHVHRPVAGTFAGIPANICGSVCPANPLWFGSATVPSVHNTPALMIHRYEQGELSCHHVWI